VRAQGRAIAVAVASMLAAACLPLAGCGPAIRRPGDLSRAATYLNTYGDYRASDLAEFAKYDVAVLDAYDYPDAAFPAGLRRAGTTVLAYLDIGEAEEFRDYWGEVASHPEMLIARKPDWHGDWTADVNDPRWRRIVVDREIPHLRSLGPMDGLCMDMLDTVDDHPGLKPGMIELVREIRKKYPELLLVPNRGFAVLPEILPYIDAFKYEDLSSEYDPASGKYVAVRDRGDLETLEAALERKDIPVLVLDHVSTSPPDYRLARADYRRCRSIAAQTHWHFVWYANSIHQDFMKWASPM